jgi:hypothetical protein
MGKSHEIVGMVPVLAKRCNSEFTYREGRHVHDLYIKNNEASLKASYNHHSDSVELLEHGCGNAQTMTYLLQELIRFCELKGVKFVEAHVSAYKPEEQRAFLDAGFKPVGYFPAEVMVGGQREDRVIMARFPDKLCTKAFEFTKKCWRTASVIFDLLGIHGTAEKTDRGNVRFYPSAEHLVNE